MKFKYFQSPKSGKRGRRGIFVSLIAHEKERWRNVLMPDLEPLSQITVIPSFHELMRRILFSDGKLEGC